TPPVKGSGKKLLSLPITRQSSIVGTEVESHHTDDVLSHYTGSQAVRVPSVR
ncbi:hypothetical protein NDU88_004097, partial [Pleurodeles waltl]